MKTVISALHFPWRDIDECLARVREDFRLDGLELSFHEKFSRPHCTKEDLAALDPAATADLVLYAHIWENIASPDEEAACRQLDSWRKLASEKGIRGLVIHGGSCPDRRKGLMRTARVLERVRGLFERSRVALFLENHYAYDYRGCQELFSTVEEFKTLFERVRSPALRFCFDTGHAHMTGNGARLLDGLAPWLAYVHLADNHGEDDDHCAYGEGTVPWREYFDILARHGFDGTMCVEFPVRENRAPFDACRRVLSDYAARLPAGP